MPNSIIKMMLEKLTHSLTQSFAYSLTDLSWMIMNVHEFGQWKCWQIIMKLIKSIVSCLASVIDRIFFIYFFACCRILISQSTRWSTMAKWPGGHFRPDLVRSKSTWCCSTRFLSFFRSRMTGFCFDVPRQLSKVSSSSTVPSCGSTSWWSKTMPEVEFFTFFVLPSLDLNLINCLESNVKLYVQ